MSYYFAALQHAALCTLLYSANMKSRSWLLRSSCVLLLVAGTATTGFAKPWWMRGIDAPGDADFLPPDVAFRVSAVVDGSNLLVRWVIADGYYLYRHTIEVKAESPDLVVSAPELPRGISKTDAYLGTQEIYTQQVEARVAYSRFDAGAHPIEIKVTYRGCAEAGLCYPPITKTLFPKTAAMPSANSSSAAVRLNSPQRWETIAILGGGFAFLLAGLALRKGRKLDLPAP